MRWIEARDIFPLVSIALVGGAALYSVLAPEPTHQELDQQVGQRVSVEGMIVRDPDVREKTAHLTFEVRRISGHEVSKGKILLFGERNTRVQYGDRVLIEGVLERPTEFETDTGRTFNYPKYLLAHGVAHTMLYPQVEILTRGEGSFVVEKLYGVKHSFINAVERALPEPESALLNGLLLGEKQSLGDRITEAMRNAGVVHIIVLSGYNVALVIQAMTFLALYVLPRSIAYVTAGVIVVAFAIMTGLSETTIRATLMALLMMVATVLRRPKVALRGLLFAAAVMSLINPYVVLYDLSFQLSVLATLGLILFSDEIGKRLVFITDQFKLREIVATTLATQITVLPLLIYSIGAVSLVFIPANILVLPAVPVAMLLGFITAVLELVSSTLAFPISWGAYLILYYIIEVSVWFGSWPLSALVIPKTWLVPVLCFIGVGYALVFLFIIWRSAHLPRLHSNS